MNRLLLMIGLASRFESDQGQTTRRESAFEERGAAVKTACMCGTIQDATPCPPLPTKADGEPQNQKRMRWAATSGIIIMLFSRPPWPRR